jgi:NAD(P)H-hydrate repair Nnr-like enzyme with NAD(P)H-hydrate epimerase domain
MLTLAPVVCVIAGIAISELMQKAGDSIRQAMLDFYAPESQEKIVVSETSTPKKKD